jgi:hypothetical protein
MGVKFPQQSVVYLVVCLSGIATFVFLGIMPSQRSIGELDARIAAAGLRMEEQKTLAPIYQALKEKANKRMAMSLPCPAVKELPRTEMDRLNNYVKEAAAGAKVQIVSLKPSLNSLADNSKSLAMETSVRGDFFALRKFLIGLGGISCLEHIEEIEIQQGADSMELKVKFRIARS